MALPKFCLPFTRDKPHTLLCAEEYVICLTAATGERTYGFCRRFLPASLSGSNKPRYPLTLCLLSTCRFFPHFFQVLEVLEALCDQGQLLADAAALVGPFLTSLCATAAGSEAHSGAWRVPLPATRAPLNVSPTRRAGALQTSRGWLELDPLPAGGDAAWAGVPLARLLWQLPPAPAAALLEALLLERRVLLVSRDAGTVSTAVVAAAASLYPFAWHHIFVPLLPPSMKDYLTAPMPFLIGMCVTNLLDLDLDGVVVVDLDMASVSLGAAGHGVGKGQVADLLPWAGRLEEALALVYRTLRSPTELEATPLVAGLLQEYHLRLVGHYREFVEPDSVAPDPAAHRGLPLPAARSSQASCEDDGYVRAHGWRFDGFPACCSFEAQVAELPPRQPNGLGRALASAGALSATNLSGMLLRTTAAVKRLRRGHGSGGALAALPALAMTALPHPLPPMPRSQDAGTAHEAPSGDMGRASQAVGSEQGLPSWGSLGREKQLFL
ncbi:hypothetical protein WJX81_007496 [Elliptochloris bilobata]|uniref:UDENN domain-containing protein n=1 Tax=Elliptochloris bilobata TaxID=381761 RepID=A0AAW1QC38_9CHLO